MTLNRRQQQKAETKRKILQAAYDVYAKNGFMATTSDISKAINVSHGTIFVHFSTKDELLICLLENFASIITARLNELAKKSDSISDVLKAHLSTIEENEGFYTRLVSENRLLPQEARNIFIGIQSIIAFHLAEAIERVKMDTLIKKFPIHFIFNTWMGLVHYYLQNIDLFAPNASVIARYKNELICNFLKLLKN